MAYPLVSLITPTFNRRAFFPRAVRCFQAQTYPDLEWIVVDSGSDAIADLLPKNDPRIRYDRRKEPANHGQLMNLACQIAEGEICCVFDDDDYRSPDSVMSQIVPILADPECVGSGLKTLLYYDVKKQQAWRYTDTDFGWLGAIAFRRSAWAAHPFAEIPNGADTEFQRHYRGKFAAVHGDLIACAIHATNAATKHPVRPKYVSLKWQEVVDFTGGDI